jgi:hypothetical protein
VGFTWKCDESKAKQSVLVWVQALANGEVDMLPAYWTPGGLYNRTVARVAIFDPAPCPTFNSDYIPFINASECVCRGVAVLLVVAALPLKLQLESSLD